VTRLAAPRRHPAEVTRDRLLDHYENYYERLSAEELHAIGVVREALYRIAEEDSE
jgi:hypothetical protein